MLNEPMRAVMQSNLSHQAKALAALFYSYAEKLPALVEIPVTTVTTALGLGEAKLRAYRSELADCGVLRSSLFDGLLAADLAAGVTPESIQAGLEQRSERLRAKAARRAASAPPQRGAPLQRAVPASAPLRRGAPLQRAADTQERAATARFDAATAAESPRAQREDPAPATPHTPLQGINLTRTDGTVNSILPDPRARATLGRSRDLLTAAGLSTRTATDLAASLTLEHIARVVARWQIDHDAGNANGLGALKYRLEHPDEWPPRPDLTWPDMQVGVLADHITEQDLRAWRFHKPVNPLAAYDVPAEYAGVVKH